MTKFNTQPRTLNRYLKLIWPEINLKVLYSLPSHTILFFLRASPETEYLERLLNWMLPWSAFRSLLLGTKRESKGPRRCRNTPHRQGARSLNNPISHFQNNSGPVPRHESIHHHFTASFNSFCLTCTSKREPVTPKNPPAVNELFPSQVAYLNSLFLLPITQSDPSSKVDPDLEK